MFYQNYDEVHGEDRWGMVGKVGDPFREDCLLAAPCYKCHRQPLVIAERNWEATNNDDSQQYQILVACTHCGAVDEFTVNQLSLIHIFYSPCSLRRAEGARVHKEV